MSRPDREASSPTAVGRWIGGRTGHSGPSADGPFGYASRSTACRCPLPEAPDRRDPENSDQDLGRDCRRCGRRSGDCAGHPLRSRAPPPVAHGRAWMGTGTDRHRHGSARARIGEGPCRPNSIRCADRVVRPCQDVRSPVRMGWEDRCEDRGSACHCCWCWDCGHSSVDPSTEPIGVPGRRPTTTVRAPVKTPSAVEPLMPRSPTPSHRSGWRHTGRRTGGDGWTAVGLAKLQSEPGQEPAGAAGPSRSVACPIRGGTTRFFRPRSMFRECVGVTPAVREVL